MPERIAAALGGAVHLSQPVRRITQASGKVTVTTDGLTATGKRVIVACSPALAGRIYYEPEMPFLRDQLMQRVPQGNLVKVTAIYPRPFWRDQGLSGSVVSTDGLANAVFDDSPPGGKPGVLLAFIGGDSARGYLSIGDPAARQAAVMKDFGTYFGTSATQPIGFLETLWPLEEWTRGCPVGLGTPGTLYEYGQALRAPVGAIHWAGTETATYWNGYMDGAVRAGERAAAEVLAEL
jgi:monoamine oxidase